MADTMGGSNIGGAGRRIPTHESLASTKGIGQEHTITERDAQLERARIGEAIPALRNASDADGNRETNRQAIRRQMHNDSYGVRAQSAGGLLETTEGMDDLDREIIEKLYTPNGIPNPYNANTTPQLQEKLAESPEFRATVETLNGYLTDPTQIRIDDFKQRMQNLMQQFPEGNIMEVLFLVFRESIVQTNEDKKYFIKKLRDYNKMGEKLSEYLDYLTDRSKELEKLKKSDYSASKKEEQFVQVIEKNFDFSVLDTTGKAIAHEKDADNFKTTPLNNLIKDCEAMQENLRNRRQIAQTSFQTFDQKTNQLYNLLTQVIKTMNEMRMAPIKNLL